MFAHFRYRSRVGTGTRLILSAILFGAKQIHFVGVDGMAPDTKVGDLHNHAFQAGEDDTTQKTCNTIDTAVTILRFGTM
jgi:hypothetical protein